MIYSKRERKALKIAFEERPYLRKRYIRQKWSFYLKLLIGLSPFILYAILLLKYK